MKTTQTNAQAYSKEQDATEIDDLISSAEEFLRTTASYSGIEIEAARGKVKRQLEAAREYVDRYGSPVGNYRQVTRKTAAYIQEHRWQTLAIIAGVSFLAGMCAVRRIVRS